MPQSSGNELGQLVLVLGLDQFVDQACGVVETYPMSLTAGCQSDAGGCSPSRNRIPLPCFAARNVIEYHQDSGEDCEHELSSSSDI